MNLTGTAGSMIATLLSLVIIVSLSSLPYCSSAAAVDVEIERIFLSGAADTTQTIITTSTDDNDDTDDNNDGNGRIIKRHHLVCFERRVGSSSQPHPQPGGTSSSISGSSGSSIEGRREKCCHELYLQGILLPNARQYCSDHIALVPTTPNYYLMDENHARRTGQSNWDVRPAYYLALDEDNIVQQHQSSTKKSDDDNDGDGGGTFQYKQRRHLQVIEDNEKESLSDGSNGGVTTFTPFHLSGFMSDDGLLLHHTDNDQDGNTNEDSSSSTSSSSSSSLLLLHRPLTASVQGTLDDNGGGMHRAFHQSMNISLTIDKEEIIRGTTTTKDDLSLITTINATIFLPLMESTFIDADDPFIVEHDDSSLPEGVSCRVRAATTTHNGTILDIRDYQNSSSLSRCNIEFIHPEIIDIEQPSFASRQYVVAYNINATVDLSSLLQSPLAAGGGGEALATAKKKLQVTIDYGTMLHIRYPSPIVLFDLNHVHGLVPIVIQQPVIYSAFATVQNNAKASDAKAFYSLQLQSSSIPDPIVIHVPAGLDSDYWLVTLITMVSALIGGFGMMKSLDSVSKWY